MSGDPERLERLETELDSFDPNQRHSALAELVRLVEDGTVFLPPPGRETNVHSHTFFSFNAYGYSPSGFAWRSRRRGLAVAGIVDFDVLHGLDEIHACGDALTLRTTGGLETRVFVPEYRSAELNSPREPGVCYFMGTAFGAAPSCDSHPGAVLERLHALAQQRNRGIMERVNAHLVSVRLDYEEDVLPLTPSRNPTERHLLAAYEHKARAVHGENAFRFWSEALNRPEDDVRRLMADPPRFHEIMRAALMKHGSPGYVTPDAGSFPDLEEVAGMIMEAGGLPTATWLDGTSEGEARIGELLDFLLERGTVVVNIIPERNWNVPEADRRALLVGNLIECVEACRARDLPVIAGTEMNKYGQPFVDGFHADELAPFVGDFFDGAVLLYGHSAAARCGGWTYFSDWADDAFGPVAGGDGRSRRNEFYRTLGGFGPLSPGTQAELRRLGNAPAVEEVLATAHHG